jgi:hypothetical protein
MTSAKNIVYKIIASSLLLLANTTLAGVISCSTANVTLNSIQLTDGLPPSGELLSQPYDATSCVGVFGDNDEGGLSSPSPNIGQLDDGLLNGEGDTFDGMEFIETEDLQALDLDGINNDPGWIHLAHFDAEGGISYSSAGPAPGAGALTLDIGDLLTLSLTCLTGTGGLSDCDSMSWLLTTKLDIIPQVQELLGPATFDHLAFSIKAGSESSGGGFAVYDFNFKEIFDNENSAFLNFNTPYKLGGTLNTLDFGGKGVSHLNVWARDPAETNITEIPEPSTIILIAISLLVLRVYKTNSKFS